MFQQLRAKWRTWREHERQYKLERALTRNRRREDWPTTHGPHSDHGPAKEVDVHDIGGYGGGAQT
jgi:hypothetical protein